MMALKTPAPLPPSMGSVSIYPRKGTPLIRALLRIMMVCLLLACASSPFLGISSADATGSKTLQDVYGVTRNEVVSWLQSHENDDYYLGTPYRPLDWRSPNGDINGYGADSDGKSAGMNCTGFVWHALCAAHGWKDDIASKLPALQGWYLAVQTQGLENHLFTSKEALLASGILEKGDIIYMWADGLMGNASDYNHIGIFWGDSPSEDKMWHSEGDSRNGWTGVNARTDIHGKASSVLFQVIKLGDPLMKPVELWAQKSDAQTVNGAAQGSATLEDARFEVRYYDGPYDASSLPANATRTWVFKTNSEGRALPSDELKVSGDELYRLPDGRVALPPGTIAIREIAAPPGYLLSDDAVRVLSVSSAAQQSIPFAFEAPTFKDDVARGGLEIEKVDRQNGGALPQGSATLEGCRFSITSLNANPVIVDGTTYGEDDIVGIIESKLAADGHYRAATEADSLPVGSYALREVSPSQGYIEDEAMSHWSETITIEAQGQVVSLDAPDHAAKNQVIRGDLCFIKADGLTGQRLAHIPFRVTSLTTGESHVLMTDSNGMISTAADWVSHGQRTNGFDAAYTTTPEPMAPEEDRVYDAAQWRSDSDPVGDNEFDECGIWFDGRSDAPVDPDDGLGALPYDTYYIEELPVDANKTYALAEFTVTINRHAQELNLGTIDNHAGPLVGTSLADDHGVKLLSVAPDAHVTDQVEYMNLTPGEEYLLEGTLHRVTEDGEDGGIVSRGLTSFTPQMSQGTTQVEFEVDTTELRGARLVAFERLSDRMGTELAMHSDINFEGQTVRVPELQTTLVDAASNDNVLPAKGPWCVVDHVSYTGLTPGETYTLQGTLHRKGADGVDEGVALDGNGMPISASQSFVAEAADGMVDVTFNFDGAELPGSTLVAFEEVHKEDGIYATHADIDNESQTVVIDGDPKVPASTLPKTEDHTPWIVVLALALISGVAALGFRSISHWHEGYLAGREITIARGKPQGLNIWMP